MPIKVLVMPAGEYGPKEQAKAEAGVRRLCELGASRFGVQVTMAKTLQPEDFIGFTGDGLELLGRIAWLTGRRVKLIESIAGEGTVECAVTDYEIEPLDAYPFNHRAAAIRSVALGVSPRPVSHYGLGTERYSMAEIGRLIDACGFTSMAMSAYPKSTRANLPPKGYLTRDFFLCVGAGVEPLPYVYALNERGEDASGHLPDLLKWCADNGASRCVAWCDLRDRASVESVVRVFDAAGGIS
jgi:hypothetical protein